MVSTSTTTLIHALATDGVKNLTDAQLQDVSRMLTLEWERRIGHPDITVHLDPAQEQRIAYAAIEGDMGEYD